MRRPLAVPAASATSAALLLAATLFGCVRAEPGGRQGTSDVRPRGSRPSSAPDADSTVRLAVPFRLDAGNVFVEVLVNGTGPHTFLLDTGSPVTALDRGLVEELALTVDSVGTASGAGGDSVPAGHVEGVAVRLGALEAAAGGAIVLPLDSLMAPAEDRSVDGVVGFPFFRDRVVELDFPAGSLRVHDADRYRYRGTGHRVPFTVRNGWAILEAVVDLPGVGPAPADLMVDLGARGNVLFTTPFVRRHRLPALLRDTARATLGMGLGGAARFLLARVDGIQLGRLWIPGVVAGFSTDRALPFRQFDGVLGAGILRRYRVVFDYRDGEMILEDPDPEPDGGGDSGEEGGGQLLRSSTSRYVPAANPPT